MKRKSKMVSLNQKIVNLYNKMQATGKTDARRMNWIQTLARKAVTGKLPRWGSVEMSPVMNNDMIKQNRRAAETLRIVRGIDLKPGEEGSVTKGEAIESMLYPWSAVPNLVSDAASIVINPARNLYNTAVDYYNAGASNRNALLQEAILNRVPTVAEYEDPFKNLDNPNTAYKKQQAIDAQIRQQGWDAYNNGNLQGNPANRKENQLTLDTGKVK